LLAYFYKWLAINVTVLIWVKATLEYWHRSSEPNPNRDTFPLLLVWERLCISRSGTMIIQSSQYAFASCHPALVTTYRRLNLRCRELHVCIITRHSNMNEVRAWACGCVLQLAVAVALHVNCFSFAGIPWGKAGIITLIDSIHLGWREHRDGMEKVRRKKKGRDICCLTTTAACHLNVPLSLKPRNHPPRGNWRDTPELTGSTYACLRKKTTWHPSSRTDSTFTLSCIPFVVFRRDWTN